MNDCLISKVAYVTVWICGTEVVMLLSATKALAMCISEGVKGYKETFSSDNESDSNTVAE